MGSSGSGKIKAKSPAVPVPSPPSAQEAQPAEAATGAAGSEQAGGGGGSGDGDRRRRNPPSRQELRQLTAGTEVEERRTLAALRDLEACLEESKVAAATVEGDEDKAGVDETSKTPGSTTSQDQGQGMKDKEKAPPPPSKKRESSAGGDRDGSTAAVAAAVAAAAGILPGQLAAALGLEPAAGGGGGGGYGYGGTSGDATVKHPGASDGCSPHVDLVRQARASVEFRVARRRYRDELEHAAALAFTAGSGLEETPAAGAAAAAAASGEKKSGPPQPAVVVKTENMEALGVSSRSKAVAAAVAAAVTAAKGPSGIRTRTPSGAPVSRLFRARVDAAPGGVPKSHRDKEIARVMRENQARALSAQAELDDPLRARFVPLPRQAGESPPPRPPAPSAAAAAEEEEEEEKTSANPSSEREDKAAAAAAAPELPAAPTATPAAMAAVARSTAEIHAARLRELKPLMTRAIRRRRLALRRRWEELGDQYAGLHNEWQGDMVRWEEKMEREEAKEAAAASGGAGDGDDGDSGWGGGVGGGGGGGGERGSNGGGTSLRSERRGGRRLSDVVRSDYEEAEVVKKFEDKHKEEERIRKGAVEVPSMLTAVERRQLPEYRDSWNSRGTTDGLQARCRGLPSSVACPAGCNCPAAVEAERKRSNLWTDVEKCIFLDKFLHHPKNFSRIASFLPRKSPEDVVQFYYDSKTSIDYKALLKEAVNRNKVGFEVTKTSVTVVLLRIFVLGRVESNIVLAVSM